LAKGFLTKSNLGSSSKPIINVAKLAFLFISLLFFISEILEFNGSIIFLFDYFIDSVSSDLPKVFSCNELVATEVI